MKKKRLPKISIGDEVCIEFLDHVEGGHSSDEDDPIQLKVYGRLAKKTKTSLTVDSWCYSDMDIPRDGNVASYTIVKSAILLLRVLH